MPPPSVLAKRKAATEEIGGNKRQPPKTKHEKSHSRPQSDVGGRQTQSRRSAAHVTAADARKKRQALRIAGSAGPIFQVQWDAAGEHCSGGKLQSYGVDLHS